MLVSFFFLNLYSIRFVWWNGAGQSCLLFLYFGQIWKLECANPSTPRMCLFLYFGCIYVINVIALSFVWNIYLSDSTMNDVLFGAGKSEINRGVSAGTLLVWSNGREWLRAPLTYLQEELQKQLLVKLYQRGRTVVASSFKQHVKSSMCFHYRDEAKKRGFIQLH